MTIILVHLSQQITSNSLVSRLSLTRQTIIAKYTLVFFGS